MPRLRGLVGGTEREERKGSDTVAKAASSGANGVVNVVGGGSPNGSCEDCIPTGGDTSRMMRPDSSTLEGGD